MFITLHQQQSEYGFRFTSIWWTGWDWKQVLCVKSWVNSVRSSILLHDFYFGRESISQCERLFSVHLAIKQWVLPSTVPLRIAYWYRIYRYYRFCRLIECLCRCAGCRFAPPPRFKVSKVGKRHSSFIDI